MGKARGGGIGRWSNRSCATLNRSSPGYFETASPPRFAAFGADLESPGMLAAAARQIAWRGEVILTCGDGTDYASPTALNTVLQLYALKLHHVLYVSDSAESCAALRRAVPSLACVWSSMINASKPLHDSGAPCRPRRPSPAAAPAPAPHRECLGCAVQHSPWP